MSSRPAPEVAIDEELVTSLLRRQHPDLAHLPLSVLGCGWDNTNFRLGNELTVRLPHREASAVLITNEQRWLPELAPSLPIAIPSLVRAGIPDVGYPWSWSINRWFAGDLAAQTPLVDVARSAEQLGQFFAALHRPAPELAPNNPYRGVAIGSRASAFNQNLATLVARNIALPWDPAMVRRVFEQAIRAEESSERVWLHGDLHARNVIVNDGEIAAIIDWGDICGGDRATDFAAAWMLVPSEIETVAAAAGANEAAWVRGKGWAVHFAILYVLHSDDDPILESIGARLLDIVTR